MVVTVCGGHNGVAVASMLPGGYFFTGHHGPPVVFSTIGGDKFAGDSYSNKWIKMVPIQKLPALWYSFWYLFRQDQSSVYR